MTSFLSFLLLIPVCRVCLYRQNSSVSCAPQLCNSKQAWSAEEFSDVASAVPPWTLGFCILLPKVTHLWQYEEWHIFFSGSLASSPQGWSRFVSVCSCCTNHLVVSADACLSLSSRVREGKCFRSHYSSVCLGFLSFPGEIAALRQPNSCLYEYIS